MVGKDLLYGGTTGNLHENTAFLGQTAMELELRGGTEPDCG